MPAVGKITCPRYRAAAVFDLKMPTQGSNNGVVQESNATECQVILDPSGLTSSEGLLQGLLCNDTV